jgi:glycosyltransferase involved in cell wall biosynthesis
MPVVSGVRPLVTIVTPSFNQARFIRETLESVLNQSYPHIEYVVMDGGSTDQTVEILRKYGGQLSWLSGRDRGQAHAVNSGWRRGRGSVVAYLNSDDVYLPGAVERAVEALERDPGAGAVYGEAYHVDDRGAILARYPSEPFSMERLEETCFICQPTVFLRREIVEGVGYLDETLRYSLDYDLWIRVARVSRFAFIPDYLARSRLHADTKTVKDRIPAHIEIMHTVRRHFGYVPPSWVYAYANAVLGPRDRSTPWRNARFVASSVSISAAEFLRQNRGIPRAGRDRWRRWRGQAWRSLFQRRP